MKRQTLAVSTGQAARYCFVTSDTIVNWIRSGLIQAQRTAGGQYRILLADLRDFMQSRGMSTYLLDERDRTRQLCWEFRLESARAPSKRKPASAGYRGEFGDFSPLPGKECALRKPDTTRCEKCVVKFLGVLDCFKLMDLLCKNRRHQECVQCDYFRRRGAPAGDGSERVVRELEPESARKWLIEAMSEDRAG